MSDSSKAKIFLADERGVKETSSFRSYQTFNFGKFFNEYKIPFGDLYALNDDSLAGGGSVKNTVFENSYVLLLPVVGAISYKDNLGNESLINAGEVQVNVLPEGTAFEISNPYESELVNYVQFQVRAQSSSSLHSLTGFNLISDKNKLIEVAGFPACLKLSIGQFGGREEALYCLKEGNKGLFVFVIEGAFEVGGRLLHPRDGLALWDVEGPIDLEALSNEAIIVLMEMGQ